MTQQMMRRRALLLKCKGNPIIVDTSATKSAYYVRRDGESTIVYANPNGSVKIWSDANTSGDFSGAAYNTVQSTQYDTPWRKTGKLRCKFGGSNTNPASSTSTANLQYAYAYWEQTGRIMFAGPYSPYYGYSNINGTRAQPGWSG